MKTLLTVITLFLLFFGKANAQITKGNWMVGGNASFSYNRTENKNINNNSGTNINYVEVGIYSISLEPNVGYFVKDKLATGIKIDYTNGFNEGGGLRFDEMNLGISPFVRYYLLEKEKMYNIFLEPSFYYFTSKNLGNSSGYGLKAGFVFFLNSSVGAETVLSYNRTSNESFNNNNVYFGFGIQVHLEKE